MAPARRAAVTTRSAKVTQVDLAAGGAGERRADLFQHRKPLLGREQRRLAGMHADGEHQPVGEAHGALAPRRDGRWDGSNDPAKSAMRGMAAV